MYVPPVRALAAEEQKSPPTIKAGGIFSRDTWSSGGTCRTHPGARPPTAGDFACGATRYSQRKRL